MKNTEFITSTDINEIFAGKLWSVTAPNGAKNYMCGTAHFSDPYVNTLSPGLRLAIGLSDEVMLESDGGRETSFAELAELLINADIT